jgi:serine/threonine-protein kinase RsbW
LPEALLMPGAAPAADLSISADMNEIRNASAWLESGGVERGVPVEQLWCLDLCLNEALANALTHGGEAVLAGKVRLRLQVVREGGSAEALVTVSDSGEAFDPLELAPRSQPRSLDEARPGGLGIPLLRQFADNLSYRRADGRNHLTFSVRWNETF